MGLLRLTNKRPDADIDRAIKQTVADASPLWSPLTFEGEFPLHGFGIASLRPYHVQNTTTARPVSCNLNFWSTSQEISSAYTDWINTSLDDDEYVLLIFWQPEDVGPQETHGSVA